MIFVLVMVCVLSQSIPTGVSFAQTSEEKPIYGISYSSLRQNQSPHSQIHPSIADIENDIKYLISITERLRIYDISGNNIFIPLIAEKYNVKLTVGLSLSNDDQKNLEKINGFINLANRHSDTIETIIVGNDILAKEIVTVSKLIEYVQIVKSNVDSNKTKVTIAETWELWTRHPSLINAVDHVTIHIYPYYQIVSIDVSALHAIGLYERFEEFLKQYNKEIVIGETGWPSDGKTLGVAEANPENQRKFIEEFMSLANKKEIKYYFFEAFDEKWKPSVLDSNSEQNFGMFYENGTMKESLIGTIPEPIYQTTRNISNNTPDFDDARWLSEYLEENLSSNLPWISNLTFWWNESSITNTDFLNAVHYLIKSDIIKI